MLETNIDGTNTLQIKLIDAYLFKKKLVYEAIKSHKTDQWTFNSILYFIHTYSFTKCLNNNL